MHVCNKAKGKQSPQTYTEQTLQYFTYLVYPRHNVYLGIQKESENVKEPRVSTLADYCPKEEGQIVCSSNETN